MKLSEAIKTSPYLRATRKGHEGTIEVLFTKEIYTTVQKFRKANCNMPQLLKDNDWEPIVKEEHLVTKVIE